MVYSENPGEGGSENAEHSPIHQYKNFLLREVFSIMSFQKSSAQRESEKLENEIKELLQELDDIEAKKTLRNILEAFQATVAMRKRNSLSIITDLCDILPITLALESPYLKIIIVIEIITSFVTTLENLRYRFLVLSKKMSRAAQATQKYTEQPLHNISSTKNIEDFIDIPETFLEFAGLGSLVGKISYIIPPLEVFLDGKTRKKLYEMQQQLYLDALKVKECYYAKRYKQLTGEL